MTGSGRGTQKFPAGKARHTPFQISKSATRTQSLQVYGFTCIFTDSYLAMNTNEISKIRNVLDNSINRIYVDLIINLNMEITYKIRENGVYYTETQAARLEALRTYVT